ncbi:hypothetical protein [Nocardia iowensis]|uniref:Uncharacterized protein n=1 Tax=Nocardia iowensis TaxID=204891 RepID=A0ABX8RIZ5_NOCIO|nr:hypothetical protein [Nocardia iowensis]QXN88847.1 hypothetical protein KV110_25065 [Nocardia iowensis]
MSIRRWISTTLVTFVAAMSAAAVYAGPATAADPTCAETGESYGAYRKCELKKQQQDHEMDCDKGGDEEACAEIDRLQKLIDKIKD